MLGPRLSWDCVGSVLISQFLSLLQALFASSISLGKDVLVQFVSDQQESIQYGLKSANCQFFSTAVFMSVILTNDLNIKSGFQCHQ